MWVSPGIQFRFPLKEHTLISIFIQIILNIASFSLQAPSSNLKQYFVIAEYRDALRNYFLKEIYFDNSKSVSDITVFIFITKSSFSKSKKTLSKLESEIKLMRDGEISYNDFVAIYISSSSKSSHCYNRMITFDKIESNCYNVGVSRALQISTHSLYKVFISRLLGKFIRLTDFKEVTSS